MSLIFVLLTSLASTATPTTCPQSCASDVRWRNLPHTDTVFQPARYDSLEAWQARREWLRGQVRVAAGLWPEPARCPLNTRIFDRSERDGYTIEKVYFESYPGFYVTGNLYRPAAAHGKVPAVAEPHGHWQDGRLHQDDVGNIPARCIMLARLGMVAFSYDMIGYNDSKRQIDHRINTPQRDLWGITSMHLQTWNSIRVLDFLASLPDVDPKRLAITGESGGGTQTFILSAIDDRLAAAAPVNMISHLMQGGCVCENAPGLRIETNNMEIAALFAPRPLLMISATGDWTKDTPNVEFPFVRGIYGLFGDAGNLTNAHIDGPHNYNLASREAMYRFMAGRLLGRKDTNSIREYDIPKLTPAELLVWTDAAAPRMLNVEQLTANLQRAAHAEIDKLAPTTKDTYAALCKVVRVGLQHALASPWPETVRDLDRSGLESASAPTATRPVDSIREITVSKGRFYGEESMNSREPGALRIFRRDVTCTRNGRPACGTEVWRPIAEAGIIPVTLNVVVDPQGRAAIDGNPRLADALAGGRDLTDMHVPIYIDPFGVAANVLPEHLKEPRGSTKFFSTFNRTDAAETAYDILTVLSAALQSGHPLRPEGSRANMLARGRLGPIALVARALLPDDVVRRARMRTVIDLNGFDAESDDAYVRDLFVPGIRRIGGLRAIAATACNGPIWFHNVGPTFDSAWIEAAGRMNGVEVRVTRELVSDAGLAAWLMK